MKFKNSFNIKYDITSGNIIDKYYATSAHAELLKNVLQGVLHEKSLNAHIAFGAYGTGKSYLSSIIGQLLSKKIDGKQLKKLTSYFNDIDSKVVELLNQNYKNKRKYLMILLNGDEGNIDDVLINKLRVAIDEANLIVQFPGYADEIVKIQKMWSDHYPKSFAAFVDHVHSIDSSLTIKEYINRIQNNDRELLIDFTEFYKVVTSGATINISQNLDVVEVYDYVCRQLDDLGYGVLVIHDEFGRYLEQLDEQSVRPFMAKMQNMAELANAGLTNLTLIFVAHKPISQYFNSYEDSIKNEFGKIEKRFGLYSIKNDYSTFIKITSKYLHGMEYNAPKKYIDYNNEHLFKYRIFNNILSDLEVSKGIIEGCYPLHPLTIFLLPQLSRVFGQNERTLFTFLTDIQLEGKTIYNPSRLVDYFFIGADKKELDTKENRAFLDNLGNLPNYFINQELELVIEIYKLIFIWSITDSNNYSLLTNSLMSYALNVDLSIIDTLVERLIELKMVRFNMNRKNLEIIDVAPIDLDAEIKKVAATMNFSEERQIQMLNQSFKHRYLYAKKYNSIHEMTRFASIFFITNVDQIRLYKANPSDLYIPVALHETIFNEIDDVNKAYYKANLNEIRHSLLMLLAIEELEYRNHTIKIYPNILTDLNYEKDIYLHKLHAFYEKFNEGNIDLIINNEKRVFHNINELEQLVDVTIATIFDLTPIVINDQINMFKISKTQENAVNRVVETVFKFHSFDIMNELGAGSKPEHLIVHSINKIQTSQYQALLEAYLNEHPEGSLIDLVRLFSQAPVGMRPYPALLMFLKCIMPYWKNIMLSNKTNFIAEISSKELVSKIISEDFDLKYVYNNFEFDNKEYLNKLEVLFPEISEQVLHKSQTIRVCSRMNNWFIHLPLIIQQEQELTLLEKQLVKIIRKMKIDPKIAITNLIQMFEFEDIELMKKDMELKFAKYIIDFDTKIKRKYAISNIEEWISQIDPVKLKNNMFANTIMQGNSFITSYAPIVEKLEISKWPISTFNMLEVVIDNDYRQLQGNVKTASIVIDGVEKLVEEVELSVKAKNMKRTVKAMLDAQAQYVTKQELEQIILDLINDYIR